MKNKPMSASAANVGRSVFLALLVGALAACASTGQQDQDNAAITAAAAASAAGAAAAASIAEAEAALAAAAAAEAAAALAAAEAQERVFHFGFDQSSITSEARAALDAHAAALQANGGSVRLEGHADARGSRTYNLALGERRANAVADYLVAQGVLRSRIAVVSYGEERPVAMGSDEAAYRMNRRVEVK